MWPDYQESCRRDLGEHAIIYLFVDGIAERIRPGQKREPVLAARAIAHDLLKGVVRDDENELPSAIACFSDDFEACIAHLRLPISHRRASHTTNRLERLFDEERRRLKIIPNAVAKKPVLKPMFGAMIRAAERWRAIRISTFEQRQPDGSKSLRGLAFSG